MTVRRQTDVLILYRGSIGGVFMWQFPSATLQWPQCCMSSVTWSCCRVHQAATTQYMAWHYSLHGNEKWLHPMFSYAFIHDNKIYIYRSQKMFILSTISHKQQGIHHTSKIHLWTHVLESNNGPNKVVFIWHHQPGMPHQSPHHLLWWPWCHCCHCLSVNCVAQWMSLWCCLLYDCYYFLFSIYTIQ